MTLTPDMTSIICCPIRIGTNLIRGWRNPTSQPIDVFNKLDPSTIKAIQTLEHLHDLASASINLP